MIYLDHHATTPLLPSVLSEMASGLALSHANPSSVHAAGRLAKAALEASRAKVSRAVGATGSELVFTSGGTESVLLAVLGVGEALGPERVLCDPGAHPCMRAAFETLCGRGSIPGEFIPLRAGAELDLDALGARLDVRSLVLVSWVQHELGVVIPWRELRALCAAKGAPWVVDAVQALGKLPVDLATLGASAAALSAHKIGGPKGIGAMWLRAGERFSQQARGGGQERGLRAGTENLLGAIGFGAAAERIEERLASMLEVSKRRDAIESCLRGIAGVEINGAERERVATCVHASVRGVAGDELVAALDVEGVCVSSSAACSSGKTEPSESLLRLYPGEPWRAKSALRMTLGPETTDAEVSRVRELLPRVIARVRL